MTKMAGSEVGGKDELKSQFITREGTYKLMTLGEYSRPNRVGYNAQANTPVKVSFVGCPTEQPNSSSSGGGGSGVDPTGSGGSSGGDRICFNVGRELYVYIYKGVKKAADLSKPVDKRVYKGTYPTSHDFNQATVSSESVALLVGFSAGQIQLIDPTKKEMSRLYNEERLIDKTKVTCLKWLPNSPNLFLVSHGSGQMYVYKEDLPCGTTPPHYQLFKQGEAFAVYTCKTKSTRNPLYRWVIGEGALNEFAFSPCSKYLATASQDGFLRIFNYDTMDLIGLVRSYFGGLLCVCWSPDGKYVVTGGEDDLVTVWSFNEKRVVARGHGHKSWVSVVAFDAFTTCYGELDLLDFSGSEEDLATGIGGTGASGTPHCGGNAAAAVGLINSQHRPTTTQRTTSNNEDNLVIGNTVTGVAGSAGGAATAALAVNGVTLNSASTTASTDATSGCGSNINSNASGNHNKRLSSTGGGGGGNRNSTESRPLNITSYRFGSVGQDTQLCLWDLTEDVLKQPLGRTRTSVLLSSPSQLAAFNKATGTMGTNSALNNVVTLLPSSKESSAFLTDSLGMPTFNLNVMTSPVGLGGVLNAQGGTKTSSLEKKSEKEHKRNFSLASRNSEKNSVNKSSQGGGGVGGGNRLLDDPVRLIGTPLCPRLDDVPMLEPLVCKKIAHERLTALVFREDCIVTACQEGYVCTWARPGKTGVLQQQIASPNLSNPNGGTIV